MSRSGKFIPGASRRNRGKSDANQEGGDKKSEPIRAGGDGDEGKSGGGGGKRRMFSRGGSRGARGKGGRKPGQLLLFAGVAFLLILGLGYYFYVIPQQQENQRLMAELRKAEEERKKQAEAMKKLQDQMAADQAKKKGTLIVNTSPKEAEIKFAGEVHKSPLRLTEVVPGEYVLLVSAPGYEAKEMPLKFEGEEVVDKGTVVLDREMGDMKITSAQTNVYYVMEGPEDYTGESKGYLPIELTAIPSGTYEVTLSHKGWETPYKFEVKPGTPVEKDIKFAYGDLVLESDPSGAEVNDGMKKLGKTPLTLKELRPGTVSLGFSKFGFKHKVVDVEVVAHEKVTKKVELEKGRDIKTSFGMELVWVPELNAYAGRYEVSQAQYQAVMGSNPSALRGNDRPVDYVTWQDAMDFCQKATARERGKGTIPSGYRFALPTESQWSQLMADSEIKNSFTSHTNSRDGSAEIGASAPNELGLYDVVGNVNEWTSTMWKGNEEYRTIRGGNWLSSSSNFPDRSKAFGGHAEKSRDKFTGFRVILER